jgi:STIP1 family protein 1
LKAIEYYTKAIELSEGSESTFFRCRAVARKNLKQFEESLKDSIQAIELEDKNIKAHLLCG